jgi:hypothetical protein
MRKNIAVVVVCSALMAGLGCGTSERDGASQAGGAALSDPHMLTGRYAFVLEESSVWQGLQSRCASEHDPKACVRAIAEAAKLEGVRLSVDKDDHLVWTSYVLSADASEETIDLEATLDAHWNEREIVGKPIGAARGEAAGRKSLPELRMERIDERTLVMNDARKGRLVFRKQ